MKMKEVQEDEEGTLLEAVKIMRMMLGEAVDDLTML